MNELAVRPEFSVFQTNGMPDLTKAGEVVAKSGIFGDITASQGTMIVVACNTERLSPIEFKRRYRFVGNELTRIPNSLLGDFKAAGGSYKIKQCDKDACEIAFVAPDKTEYTCRITMEEMLATGIPFSKDGKTLKTNWQKFPDDMLFARVTGKAMRRIWPEGSSGIYTSEEAEDFVPLKEAKLTPSETRAKIHDIVTKAREQVKEVEAEVVGADDVTICPIPGKDCFGVKWEDFESDRLAKVLQLDRAKFPMMTDEHIAEVKRVLEVREAELEQQAAMEDRQ